MPILIIGGMHRSGTTLTARLLHQAGLFIGADLLKSKYDHANPDGNHYEDTAFLDLHRQILIANNLSSEGYLVDETAAITPRFHDAAQAILQERDSQSQWGWKEPRTCLFMDFWREYLPDAYTLVVYRHYEQVADSLLRRKLNHEKLLRRIFYNVRYYNRSAHVAHYIAVWNRYNRDLLKVVQQSPEKALVLRIGDVVSRFDDVVTYLNREWGFDLATGAAEGIYQKNRLHKEAHYVDIQAESLADVAQTAQATYEQLESWREQSLAGLE